MFKKKDAIPDLINDVLQTKGIERSLLEVQLIKEMTSNLKWQFWQNLLCIIIGALIPIIYSLYIDQYKNQLQLKLLEKQTEIYRLNAQIEKHRNQKVQSKQISIRTIKSSTVKAK